MMAKTLNTGSQMKLHSEVISHLLKSFNEDTVSLGQSLTVLCSPPKYSTLRINVHATDMACAVEKVKEYLKKQCAGTEREDYNMYTHPTLPDCVIIENRGPYSITQLPTSVGVDMACGMAVLRGANVFVQGILAAPKGLRCGDWVSVYAHLEGKCLKGSTTVDTKQALFLGNGVSAVGRSDLFGPICPDRGLGILMNQALYEAPSLNDLHFDWAFPQNLPSIACIHVLDPQPGEKILDMCAAPGGKTSHIASRMKNEGCVIALEKSSERTKKMQQMLHNMGLTNVQCHQFDATKACSIHAQGNEDSPPFSPASFDRILVDAPCSALGQRPCHVNRISLSQLKSFPIIQRKLLNTAAQLLRPGGVLVYSTCTICIEENEDQVAHLLKSWPDLQLVDTPHRLAGPGLHCSGLTETQNSLVQRFDPSPLVTHFHTSPPENTFNIDTIGFFVAKFEKNVTPSVVDDQVLREPPHPSETGLMSRTEGTDKHLFPS